MKTEKYFHLLQKAFGKISTAKFIRKLISDFKDDPRGYTEEKDLSRSDRGHYLSRGRGADATMAAVRSTVKIDDLLALHQRLTGRQKRLRILRKRWVRKLHRIEVLF
jgi:hypothetical protein